MSPPIQVWVDHTHIMWAACMRMRRQPKCVWAYGTEQNIVLKKWKNWHLQNGTLNYIQYQFDGYNLAKIKY